MKCFTCSNAQALLSSLSRVTRLAVSCGDTFPTAPGSCSPRSRDRRYRRTSCFPSITSATACSTNTRSGARIRDGSTVSGIEVRAIGTVARSCVAKVVQGDGVCVSLSKPPALLRASASLLAVAAERSLRIEGFGATARWPCDVRVCRRSNAAACIRSILWRLLSLW